jgi:hypothetical protein
MQAAASLVVVPSAWDTFNFTVAEAMAAGRVVVCSDGAGAGFLIRDGVNGFLFGAGNAGSLCGALQRALALGPFEALRVGEAARQTVAEQLHPARTARARLDRLCALAARGRPFPAAIPDWLKQFVDGDAGRSAGYDFLANVGIRDLSRHLARRLRDRVLEHDR